MELKDLLQPDRIILGLRAADKAQALGEMAKRASAHLPVQAPAIVAALAARERLGSTGFGRGFALPHVRINGVPALFGVLARLAKPIEYDSIDGKPVDVMFMLLIPPDTGNEHVAALAAVSRSMRDDSMMRAVRTAGSSAELFRVLTG